MSDTALTLSEHSLARQPGRWSARFGAAAAALGTLASYAVFRAAANHKLLPGRPVDIIDWAIFFCVDFLAVLVMYRAWHASGDDRTRQAWMLFTLGGLASAIAATNEAVLNVVYHQVALPWWVHAGFSLSYLLYLAGLLSFPIAPRRRADRITLSFDIATVILSAVMVLWYWCVRTGAFDPVTTLGNELVVIGYPAADLTLLLTAAILLVRSVDARNRNIFAFLAMSYLSSSIADFWYGYLQMNSGDAFERTTIVDLCWLAAVLFPILAAAAQLRYSRTPHETRREEARWLAEIPLIAIGLAFAMLFLAIRENREGVEVPLGVGALVMTVLAIARQRISARDAATLMNERATRDARFRALVQNSSDVVVVLDGSLDTTYVSPAIEGVLGQSVERGLARKFTDWVAVEDRPAALELLARVAAIPFATELQRSRMVHADGTLRTMETLATNLLHDPAVQGIVLNSRDITQRTALEEQLQHTQKLEVVGRLAGGIAHDFNNLLMVIGANAEFVLCDDDDVAARREAAEEIKDTTKRAAALTKQLLAFSRRQESRPVVINPNDIVRHVERMLLRLMQHAARVETDLTDEPSAIEIDPGQLEQALLNLAVNSRDAMPNGGVLRMRTRKVQIVERTMVDRGVLTPGDYVTISVVDTGAGMSAEVRSRIFEPFFTTKPIGSGTGLGLAMVLGVVQQVGGQVQVHSELGAGTSITLYFRAVGGKAKQAAERPHAAAMRGTGRILVVDDEEGVRTVLQKLLRRIGYEVDAVGDAETAIAMLMVTPLRFDLVLSDILMPDKTGLEMATDIIEKKIPVPIVLMTGFADGATVREATERHRLPVLRKPFEVDQLAVIVEDALSRGYARRNGM